MRLLITGIIVFLILFYFYLIWPRLSRKRQIRPFLHTMFAHRGYHCIEKGIPENSIPSFRAAISHGYGIELKIPKSSLGICEKTWEILKNYNGPYMVQSFNTLGIWWFRRHVPHVLRGQLSSNLTADRLPEPWILTFVVKHLLGNVLGRPDFISYKLADLPMFEVWFLKHILHLPVAVWTLRTPDALKKGKRHYDMQIFEKKNTYY